MTTSEASRHRWLTILYFVFDTATARMPFTMTMLFALILRPGLRYFYIVTPVRMDPGC